MKSLQPAFVLIILFHFLVLKALSQQHLDDHKNDMHQHKEMPNEIGGAFGLVFDISENNTGFGLHLHYTRNLKDKLEKLGIGGSLESVFSEHNHYNVSAAIIYRPVHPLWIAAGPGITYFTDSDQFRWALHLETGYEFDVHVVHLGPVIEYAFAGKDHHLMIGLHIGYPF